MQKNIILPAQQTHLEGAKVARDFDVGAWRQDGAVHTRVLTKTKTKSE